MNPICRHCSKSKVNRPRGLCWSCYYTPGVKELFPSTSKYARQEEEVVTTDQHHVSTPPVEGAFAYSVDGHTLTGDKRRGVWTFACPSWPDLAARWAGATDVGGAVAEFMRRVDAGGAA